MDVPLGAGHAPLMESGQESHVMANEPHRSGRKRRDQTENEGVIRTRTAKNLQRVMKSL
jgi:hypothetical protein